MSLSVPMHIVKYGESIYLRMWPACYTEPWHQFHPIPLGWNEKPTVKQALLSNTDVWPHSTSVYSGSQVPKSGTKASQRSGGCSSKERGKSIWILTLMTNDCDIQLFAYFWVHFVRALWPEIVCGFLSSDFKTTFFPTYTVSLRVKQHWHW